MQEATSSETQLAEPFRDRDLYLAAEASDIYQFIYDDVLQRRVAAWNESSRRQKAKTLDEATAAWGDYAHTKATMGVLFRDQLASELTKINYQNLHPETQVMAFTLCAASQCFSSSWYEDISVNNLMLTENKCPVEDRVKIGHSRLLGINPTIWSQQGLDPTPQYAGEELSDIMHATIVDFTDLLETEGLRKFVEKFCDNPIELDDGRGRREIHIPTAFGFNLAYIEQGETRRLIAYPFDEVLASDEDQSDVQIPKELDEPVIDWAKTSRDWHPAQLSLMQPGTTIINATNDTIAGLVGSRLLYKDGVLPRLRMTNVPNESARRRLTRQGRLPTDKEMGVEGWWGTFDPHRLLLLEPNKAVVEKDIHSRKTPYRYDPDTVVTLLVSRPLRNSGKGIVESAQQIITYYLRFGPSGNAEVRRIVDKTKRAKSGEQVLRAVRDHSAMIANTIEQEGLRHPILAGLPTLGKKR